MISELEAKFAKEIREQVIDDLATGKLVDSSIRRRPQRSVEDLLMKICDVSLRDVKSRASLEELESIATKVCQVAETSRTGGLHFFSNSRVNCC